MTNTPSDDGLFELIKEHFDLDKRQFDTVIDRKTGRFHDAARYRDFASAVLARWGTPQPVVREPLTDAQIAEMMRDTWGCASIAPRHALEFARAVERAHGIDEVIRLQAQAKQDEALIGQMLEALEYVRNTPEAEYDSKAALSKAQAAITAARKRLENT